MPLSEIVNTLRPQTNAQYVGGSPNQPLLTTGQTFVSPWISNSQYARITGHAFATGIGGTITIDQGGDATNADATVTSVTVVNGTPISFSVEAVAAYVRITYTNGAGTQTVFRLYTNLRHV